MKKLISLALALITVLSLVACVGEGPAETTPAPTPEASTPEETPEASTPVETDPPAPPATDREIVLADNGTTTAYIVMPRGKSQNTVYAKDKLFYFIKNNSGVELDFGKKKDHEFEILLGNTGREESNELAATLTGNQYAIKIGKGKVVISATEFAFLYDAVEYFIENYLKVEDNRIVVNTVSDTYIGEGDTTSLRYIFSKSKSDSLKADMYRADGWPDDIVAYPEGPTTNVQGGCTDGTYYYQAFIYKDVGSNEEKNPCMILKHKLDFDPNTNDFIAASEILSLNHTNDITYNARTNELIVVHNNPNRTTLSVIDPDTLTLKRKVTIPYRVYSIAYDYARDLYVFGLSGGQDMGFLDAEFKEVPGMTGITSTDKTAGYTTQGITCDDTFIYHTLWNSPGNSEDYNRNVIVVYDWYGNFVATIGTQIEIESENLDIIDGHLYVVANSWGGKAAYIYRIEPKIN